MLSYFLITWVVAFFVLCLPLLFMTDKEKEAMRKTKEEISEEFQKKISLSNDEEYYKVLDEHYKEYEKLTKKREDVVFRTTILNTIFLIILPYVIFFEFKNSYYIISLVHLIFFIYLLSSIKLSPGVGDHVTSDSDKFLELIFVGPGKFVVNLAVK